MTEQTSSYTERSWMQNTTLRLRDIEKLNAGSLPNRSTAPRSGTEGFHDSSLAVPAAIKGNAWKCWQEATLKPQVQGGTAITSFLVLEVQVRSFHPNKQSSIRRSAQ